MRFQHFRLFFMGWVLGWPPPLATQPLEKCRKCRICTKNNGLLSKSGQNLAETMVSAFLFDFFFLFIRFLHFRHLFMGWVLGWPPRLATQPLKNSRKCIKNNSFVAGKSPKYCETDTDSRHRDTDRHRQHRHTESTHRHTDTHTQTYEILHIIYQACAKIQTNSVNYAINS